MSSPKVTIQIVTWNSLRYLPNLLDSIFRQTYRDFQVLVVDNNSSDETVKFLRANYPDVAVFQNNRNFGFAKGNNQGIRLLNSPFVLLCNPDIILEPDWLEKAMELADDAKFSDCGSFGGKLLKMKMLPGDFDEVEKTRVIDSCGLKVMRSRQVVELGAGEQEPAFTKREEVFGHSAALALYRREALESISLPMEGQAEREYFDEDFFYAKEDVDLAWRLRLFGWKSLYDPSLLAYHARTSGGSEKTSLMDNIRNKRDQSAFGKYHAYRNDFLMLMKNEYWQNIKDDFWQILKMQVLRFGHYLLLDPGTLRAIGDAFKLRKKMKAKSRIIKDNPKASAETIRKWLQ